MVKGTVDGNKKYFGTKNEGTSRNTSTKFVLGHLKTNVVSKIIHNRL